MIRTSAAKPDAKSSGRSARIKQSAGGKIFDAANAVFLGLCSIITIVPFLYVVSASFATEREIVERPLFIIPRDVSIAAYRYIFSSSTLTKAFANSVFITVSGTAINMFFTVTMAYALSKRYLHGRNFLLNIVIFSMFFSGGMIPGYIIVRALGMLDTYWSVLLPGAISAYNMMIIKNFFQNLPDGLEESARLDGCTDLGALIRVVLPLSLPIVATFSLFYAVSHWNAYFAATLYMSKSPNKWPLQVTLRNLILLSSAMAGDAGSYNLDYMKPPDQSTKMAVIVVSTVPILCVYPFLQRHFAKGVMVGALKG
ncbi:MAG: carbohydrate ABC transporter permease [Oscillospiraceae bacterium]|jgi:putative aldouronate transport system permease protein|nr:carbohydrate ABC transporter permease [Oscillospiraceae bacterium]